MKLYLHIGMEKTATTSTQEWFSNNRQNLIKQGIYYSQVLGPVSHRKLCLWALDKGVEDSGFHHIGVHTAAQHDQFRTNLAVEFAAEVAAAQQAGCQYFVVSNELLHSRITTASAAERLAIFLQSLFPKIEVLCFFRPQIDVAVSHTSTLSRDRVKLSSSSFDIITPDRHYYNYHSVAMLWANAFGTENLNLQFYRDWATAAGYLIDRLNIDMRELSEIPRVNEALDISAIALVNNTDTMVSWADGTQSDFSRLFLDKLDCVEKISIGPEMAHTVQARFDESNQALIKAWPKLDISGLAPDYDRYNRPSNMHKLDQATNLAPALSQMVNIFNQRIALQEANSMLDRAEIALMRHRLDRCHEFCTNAAKPLERLKNGAFGAEVSNLHTRLEQIKTRHDQRKSELSEDKSIRAS